MNEQERAAKFSNELHRKINGVWSEDQELTGEDRSLLSLSERLLTQTAFAADPKRQSAARARLRDRFLRKRESQVSLPTPSGWVRVAGFSLAVSIVVFGMVWMIRDLTGQTAAQPTVQPSPLPVIETPIATSTAISDPAEEEIFPARQGLVLGACTLPGDMLDDPTMPWGPHEAPPEALAGGARIEVAGYTFQLELACDARFQHQPLGDQMFSEIDELGIFARWAHPGWGVDGELIEYSGIEPFVRESGSSSVSIDSQMEGGRELTGLQLPSGIIPDFSQADERLRYVIKVQGPDGSLAGAALSFTLQRETDGYRPVDVVVEAISNDELLPLESDPVILPTFPVKSPYSEYPVLQEITTLIEPWERSLTSGPGWVHLLDRVYDNRGNQLYGGLSDYNSEQWLLLDEDGFLAASVFTEWADDGRILQQAYTENGKGTNLTFGNTWNSHDAKPTRLYMGNDIINRMLAVLRRGQAVGLADESFEGKPVLVISSTETYLQPITLNSRQVVEILVRDGIDRRTGAWLFTETLGTTTDGEQILTHRRVFQVAERVLEPPDEVMAVFEEEFSGYRPADPIGTPAPAGFDPSRLPLNHVSIVGDDLNHPGFFFGDISAGGYFLGRVDFGSSPGGWCRRSADGSKLAFKHQILAGSKMSSSEIRWVDLLDGARVHVPAPDLFVDSQLAWSPVREEVAFFACRADRTDCGLHLLDTATDQVRFVSGVGTTLWDPLWSPDGAQVAFVDTGDSDLKLFVVEVSSGDVVYEAPFDGDAWKAADDAPIYQWGVDFPHGWDGGNCFER